MFVALSVRLERTAERIGGAVAKPFIRRTVFVQTGARIAANAHTCSALFAVVRAHVCKRLNLDECKIHYILTRSSRSLPRIQFVSQRKHDTSPVQMPIC